METIEAIEVKWAIHEDVVAMEHSLKVIASVRPCSHCDGTGVEPLTERVACCHCDGHRTVPVLTARDAATVAALALKAMRTEATDAND